LFVAVFAFAPALKTDSIGLLIDARVVMVFADPS
jgi:hypothetical protein